jgi:hypothetical protein
MESRKQAARRPRPVGEKKRKKIGSEIFFFISRPLEIREKEKEKEKQYLTSVAQRGVALLLDDVLELVAHLEWRSSKKS